MYTITVERLIKELKRQMIEGGLKKDSLICIAYLPEDIAARVKENYTDIDGNSEVTLTEEEIELVLDRISGADVDWDLLDSAIKSVIERREEKTQCPERLKT